MTIKTTILGKQIFEVVEYFIVIFLILDCRSLWQRLTNTPSWFNIFLWGGLLLSIVICLLVKKKFDKNNLNIVIFTTTCLILYFTGYTLLNPSNVGNYLKFMLAALAIYVYIKLYCGNDPLIILNKYRDVMLVLALISLFFWLFGSTLNIIPSTGKVHTNWDTVFSKWVPTWYHVYYTTQRSLVFGNYIFRNTSIFTEAPMASFHFSLAFLIEVLLNNGKKWRAVVFIVTIISTLSMTGLFVIMLVVVMKYMSTNSKTGVKFILIVICFPIVLYLVVSIMSTLFTDKMDSISGQARLRDYIEGFELWLQHPIIGYGYKSELVSSVGFSNSITPIITQCGLYIFSFYIFFIIRAFHSASSSHDKNILIFDVVYLFLFLVTNVAFQHLTLFFVIILGELHKKNDDVFQRLNRYFMGDFLWMTK